MLRQQRKHFAAMLAAAIFGFTKFFWPQLLAVNMLGNNSRPRTFCGTLFSMRRPDARKNFPENHVIAC